MNIRKGDKVLILSGNERGKSGKVLKIFPEASRAIVEGLNFIKKHSRPSSKNQQGGIIEKEAPIHLSNLRLICPGCSKASGVRRIRDAENKLVRECRSCGEIITAG
jgi:large subunit ribosomal protein L24